MDIKEKLKMFDIAIGEFAEKLKITRPTLNNYIKQFEEGENIPNSKYQFIFERLFDDGIDSKSEFVEELERFHYLIERDKFIGTADFNMEKTDLLTSVMESIRSDLAKEDYDKGVYKFINKLVTSYRSESIFIKFVNYFLYLNNIYEVNEIKNEDKAFISNCYKLMNEDKNNNLKIDREYFSKFITRAKCIEEENKQISTQKTDEALKLKLQKVIDEKVKEQLKLGLDANEINYEEIINNIEFSKLKE